MLADENSVQARREELLGAIADKRFPCVGAKSAMARDLLKTVACHSLASARDDLRVHSHLLEWVSDYRQDRRGLRSLAVMFDGPTEIGEERFEAMMWERLQALAHVDHSRGQPYDPSVSADPGDPQFSLSFGGAAFFVIGLHPNASRTGRRVPRPTLVFNLHDQFERLREEGRYDRLRKKIISRDVSLCGSVNPMLARFGDSSQAPQYSGRVVEANWRCPFRDPRAA